MSSSSECTCTCRLYCRRYNRDLAVYEGSGQTTSHSTRQRHRDDDRIAECWGRLPHQSASLHTESVVHSSPDDTPLASRKVKSLDQLDRERHSSSLSDPFLDIERELNILEHFTGSHHLVFVHDPKSSLYTRPDNLFAPNHGPHSLRATSRINYPHMHAEQRLCDLFHLCQRLEGDSVRREQIEQRIETNLLSLQAQKESEWYRQRGDISASINTGMSLSTPHTSILKS